jgi:gliding motility-associated-like protein
MKNLYSYIELSHYLRKVVLFILVILSIGTQRTFAEGTKQLAPSSSDRLYLALCFDKYGNFGRYDGTPEQRLYIHIENPETEKVYFGFSQFVTNGHYPNNGGKTDVYIRIKNPNGDVVWPNANNAAGFKIEDGNINSWEEVSHGPKQLVGSDGYNAMMFDPSGLSKGDYYIEFSKSESVYNDDKMFTEWWDISVVDSKVGSKLKDGRVWSKNWAFQSPGYKHYRNGKWTFDSFVRPFNGKVYSYCTENNFSGGYVTEVDFKDSGFRGAAFNLAFNWSGASATDDFTINRKSVPEENRLSPEFPIFLNDPDSTIYVSAEDFGHFVEEGVDGLPKLFGCPDTGYYFRVAVDKKGRIEMILDFNNNGKFDPDLGEVVITQLFKPYPNESSPLIRDIYWDGKNANGIDVDPSQVHVMFNYIQGTFHFPMYDVEFLTNGIVPKTVRPKAPKILIDGSLKDYVPKLYWDDRDITGNLMNGQPKVELTGDLAPSHAWNTYNYGTDSGYGNRNSINTYWHSYNSIIDKICVLEEPEHTCELFVPKSISGTVFEDTNRNGLKDDGELPLMGATVKLFWDKSYNQEIDADDELIEEFTTKDLGFLGYNNKLGNYIFKPQIGRQYLVEVSFEPHAVTGVNPRSYSVYSSGVEYYNQNFGVAPLAEVSLSVSKPIIQENNESSEIIVDLNYPTLVPVTIELNYSGTAEGIDYNLTLGLNAISSTSIVIPEGESRGVIELSSVKDVLNEDDEFVDISISSTVNGIENGEQIARITIIDGNHAIANLRDRDEAANTISENVEANAVVHITALATDEDNDVITYHFLDDADGRFKFKTGTSIVVVADASQIDYETNTLHTIKIEARSSDGSKVAENFTIAVTDVDGTGGDTDHAIANLIDNDPAANTISENAKFDDLVHITALATDEDNDVITYHFLDDADGRFKFKTGTSIVVVADASQIDYETNMSHTIKIEARSTDGSKVEETFTIAVTNVDGTGGDTDHAIANLIDNDPAANTISENAKLDDLVHITALATDADDDNITYFLLDDAGGRFKVNETTGIVTVSNAAFIDFETDEFHNIRIEARSTDGSVIADDFRIDVTDVDGTGGDTDHAISNLIDNEERENIISENAINDAPVYITAHATDLDDDAITYHLIDDDNGRFKIEELSGVVTVKDENQIDFESNASHSIRIEARSADGSKIAGDFPIFVTDVDESGGDTDHAITNLIDNDLVDNVISEFEANDSPVHITALATDADDDNITYYLLDDAGGRFKINETTGVVVVADASLIDFETNISHTIRIEARSTDGSVIAGDFTISITDVNEILQANDDSSQVNEDDILNGENLLTNDYKVPGTNLTINTNPVVYVTNGSLVIHNDGTYTYTPNLDFSGIDSFIYSVCDDGTPQQCDEATVNITIVSVNDGPLAMNDEAEVNEDEILDGASVLDNDSDVDSDAFEINTSPIEDVEHGVLTINTNGTYTYIPDTDFNGTDMFTYEVCDNETLAACGQATVTISVLPVNDAPRVFDFEMEVKEASLNNPINLESPFDPDGDELSVKILATVDFGEIVLSNGQILNDNDVISVDDLLSMEFNTRERYIGELTMLYEVSDESGLSTQGRVEIIIVPIDVFIPNAITPNNDSLNDKFKIVGLERFPENSLEIFNRWGNIVYKKRDYDNNWEGYGNVKGQISNNRLPPGTYYYIFKFGIKKQPLSGYVYMTY